MSKEMDINGILAGMSPAELAEFNAAGMTENANPTPQQYSNYTNTNMHSGNTNNIYGNGNTVINGNQIHFHAKSQPQSQYDDYCYTAEEIRQEALENARNLINNAIPKWKEKGFSSQQEYLDAIEMQKQIRSYRAMSVAKFIGKTVAFPVVGLAKMLWWTALTINGNNPYQVAQRRQQLLSSTPSDAEVEEIIETTIIEEEDKAEARRILQNPPTQSELDEVLNEYQKESRTPVVAGSSANSIYALMG
jgi:hypothetical protein